MFVSFGLGRALRTSAVAVLAGLAMLVTAAPANAADSRQVQVKVKGGVTCINVEVDENTDVAVNKDGSAGWKSTNVFVRYGDTINVISTNGSASGNGRSCGGDIVKQQNWISVPKDTTNATSFWFDLS